MPRLLASLLHRSRASLLALLIVVLPLQAVAQLVAGLQTQRHVHAQPGLDVASPSPLRLLLDRLHAAQPASLKAWGQSAHPAGRPHAHGDVVHTHEPEQAGVIPVASAEDDPAQGAVTAFLAWLPVAPAWPAAHRSPAPVPLPVAWQDRLEAPPLAPPRG